MVIYTFITHNITYKLYGLSHMMEIFKLLKLMNIHLIQWRRIYY